MSFISEIKTNYTNKRMNKIKQLERSIGNQKGAIKSNKNSPEIVSVNKKTQLRSIPSILSIGKNLEYNIKSLQNNPAYPKTTATTDFIAEFENNARSLGITAIGYTITPSEVVFKDKAILYPNTIVLTKEIEKNQVDNELPGKSLTDLKLYDEFGKKTGEMTNFLRNHGFGAHTSHPAIGSVTYPILAQYAGLGWRGKSNLLITPELGPRQKISAIFVSIENLPIKEYNEHAWIADYCKTCEKCIKTCPKDAIVITESENGQKESKLVYELCRGCYESCTICMKECPFNKRDYNTLKNRFGKINNIQQIKKD